MLVHYDQMTAGPSQCPGKGTRTRLNLQTTSVSSERLRARRKLAQWWAYMFFSCSNGNALHLLLLNGFHEVLMLNFSFLVISGQHQRSNQVSNGRLSLYHVFIVKKLLPCDSVLLMLTEKCTDRLLLSRYCLSRINEPLVWLNHPLPPPPQAYSNLLRAHMDGLKKKDKKSKSKKTKATQWATDSLKHDLG